LKLADIQRIVHSVKPALKIRNMLFCIVESIRKDLFAKAENGKEHF
jgi:hypothetical protein